jgi:hypothetical protein
MRQLTNLGWPQTPFGPTGRPVQKPAQWLAALSLLWGDDSKTGPVIMGAALVVVKVERTKSTPVSADLLHFGYRAMVPESLDENDAVLTEIDQILVQARREAQVIAWHNGADDLHVLRQLSRPEGTPRLPGIEAVAQAWKDRTQRERGVALCVDTSHDLGPTGLVTVTARAHQLEPMPMFLGVRQQNDAQDACDDMARGVLGMGQVIESLAASVLSSALTTALLGGKATERLNWDETVLVSTALAAVAWDELPHTFGSVRVT